MTELPEQIANAIAIRKIAHSEALAYMEQIERHEISKRHGAFMDSYPKLWNELWGWLKEHSE